MSGFHPIATSIEAQISRVGIGIDQLMRGDFGKAAKNIIMGSVPFANWYSNFKEGDSVIKALMDPANAPPQTQRIATALGMANGRIFMHMNDYGSTDGAIKWWKSGAFGDAWQQALKDHPDNRLKAAFNIAGRVVDSTMAPVMDYVVPRQKMGVFSRMMEDWMDSHPNVTDQQLALKAQDIWDSVDNRLGEMNYDNLFWHKALKDASFLAVRSVGWNMGTLREIGGGMYEGAQQGLKFATGRDAEWTHRMSYLLALPIVTGMYGAIYNYLSTGQSPQEPKDLFFPRTGFLLPDGAKQRVSIPGYMRDVYAYSAQPWQTIKNKMHPMIALASQAWDNQDYYGDIIRNYDDPIVKQVEDVLGFAMKNIEPFSFSGEGKMSGTKDWQQAIAMAGVQPSPGYIADPEAQERWEDRQHRQMVHKTERNRERRANPEPLREDDEGED